MSGNIPQMNINDGFNFALYLTPPITPNDQFASNLRKDGFQIINNSDTTSSYNDFERMSKNSKINNFLSNDLIKNLEAFSPSKSFISIGSHFNQLTINEIENEKRNEDLSDLISPINIRDNKHFKLDTNDTNQIGEKSIIQLISPANNEKQGFDFTKNNYIPRKNEGKCVDNKNEININYYANNININNNNSYYDQKQINEKHKKISQNIEYETKFPPKFNNFHSDPYQNNFNNLNYNQQSYTNSILPMAISNNVNDDMQCGFSPSLNNMNFSNFQPIPNNMFQEQLYPSFQMNPKMYNNAPKIQKNENSTKKKRQFAERQGDWVCMKCKNLNFSFRVVCNRCQLPKSESEALYIDHMNNLKKLNKQNDYFQNQIFTQSQMQMNCNNSFNTNLFSPNTICNINTIYGNFYYNLR